MPISLGQLHIDRTVAVRGSAVELRPAELRLLRALAAEPLRVHRFGELCDELGIGSDALQQTVCRLRRALGTGAIVTVRRVGYRLDPEALS